MAGLQKHLRSLLYDHWELDMLAGRKTRAKGDIKRETRRVKRRLDKKAIEEQC